MKKLVIGLLCGVLLGGCQPIAKNQENNNINDDTVHVNEHTEMDLTPKENEESQDKSNQITNKEIPVKEEKDQKSNQKPQVTEKPKDEESLPKPPVIESPKDEEAAEKPPINENPKDDEIEHKPPIVEEQIIDLKVPHYNQYAAGAPMGCEAASLLQALQYKGYAINYTLEEFLKEMPYSPDNNPYQGYAGSPYISDMEGIYQSIFPAPLTAWGKKYGNVSNTTGISAEEIISEVENGNPVVVYVVYKYGQPKWVDWTFKNGEMSETHCLIDNAHVMTVSGYNPHTKEVKVTDPAPHKGLPANQKAEYWVSWSNFKRCYEYMKYSVVVR